MLRRLSRMSPAEVIYRLGEQTTRAIDRCRRFAWSDFSFDGRIEGLPGIDPERASDAHRALAATAARAYLDGDLILLGMRWPKPAGRPWWRDPTVWLTDPESGRLWPGQGRLAWDAPLAAQGLGDVKRLWELNRLQGLGPLALHARLSGDAAAADAVFDILEGWMDAHPPFQGIAWRGGVEAATRAIALLAALAFLEPKAASARAAVGAFLRAHVYWIARYPSRFSSANNHRVAETVALFLAALCAPALFPEGHLGALRRAAESAFLAQFHPDGGGREQSPAYAALSLEWFALCALAAEAKGAPFGAKTRGRMGQAAEALSWLLDAGGRAPRIGDGDDSRVLALTLEPEPRRIASVIALAARAAGGPEPTGGLRDPALRDLAGAASPSAPPQKGRRTFPDAGMTVWRCARSDGDLLLVFDHGPLGHLSIAAHGHADALAVWLHWGEEAVLIDPGAHRYHGDEGLRSAMRGTPSHNTLAVEGQDQSRIIGPFAWSRHARARLVASCPEAVEAEHYGYLRRFGLIHRRRVQVEGHEILIEDKLIGSQAPRAFSVGFTVGAEVSVQAAGRVALLTTPAGRRLRIESLAVGQAPAIEWTSAPTPAAPAFGRLETATRLTLHGRSGACDVAARVRLTLAPYQQRPT
jgi:hypothetical protein